MTKDSFNRSWNTVRAGILRADGRIRFWRTVAYFSLILNVILLASLIIPALRGGTP